MNAHPEKVSVLRWVMENSHCGWLIGKGGSGIRDIEVRVCLFGRNIVCEAGGGSPSERCAYSADAAVLRIWFARCRSRLCSAIIRCMLCMLHLLYRAG